MFRRQMGTAMFWRSGGRPFVPEIDICRLGRREETMARSLAMRFWLLPAAERDLEIGAVLYESQRRGLWFSVDELNMDTQTAEYAKIVSLMCPLFCKSTDILRLRISSTRLTKGKLIPG